MTRTVPLEAVKLKLFHHTGIRRNALDPDAVKVISRLRRKGHETFFVGGCVRDLLLSRRPKDFDVATSARPRQIKSLFRNCRIIGRRFKLAHLHFDDKILEVSTFRRRPEQDGDEEDDLLIRSDNAFGSANEDAHRRDFTINGLFLDPESDCIHDYVGGIEDIERGVVRTIGDPLTRIKEDPVRILRAVKFASRLSLKIDPRTWGAMCGAAEDLSRSAPPRLLEELSRLMRSGNALQAFQLMRDCGALQVLLPEVMEHLTTTEHAERLHFWRMLEAVDSLVRQEEPLTSPVLFGALFFDLLERAKRTATDKNGKPLTEGREMDIGKLAESLLGPILKRLNFSRAESGRLKRISVVQRRFDKTSGRRGFRPSAFVRQDYFAEALALFRLRCIADDQGWEEYDGWAARHGNAQVPPTEIPESRIGPKPSPRRRATSQAPVKKVASKRQSSREASSMRKGRGKTRGRRKKEAKLPPLPPVELDPHDVPTYGSILGDTGSAEKIELESSKSKRARKKKQVAEEPYVPPPPPEEGPARNTDEDDVFGDW